MKNKAIWIGGIIGGLYALIPSLTALYWNFNATSGDPGPYWLFMLPQFRPALISFDFSANMASRFFKLINLSVLKTDFFEVFVNITNIILWVFIGAVVGAIFGLLIKKLMKKKIK